MFPKTRSAVARIGLGISLWLGVYGQFASFYPGAAFSWFGTAAGLAALGLLSRKWGTRVFALVLVIWFAWCAWEGRQQGRRYEEWLSQQPWRERAGKGAGDER